MTELWFGMQLFLLLGLIEVESESKMRIVFFSNLPIQCITTFQRVPINSNRCQQPHPFLAQEPPTRKPLQPCSHCQSGPTNQSQQLQSQQVWHPLLSYLCPIRASCHQSCPLGSTDPLPGRILPYLTGRCHTLLVLQL